MNVLSLARRVKLFKANSSSSVMAKCKSAKLVQIHINILIRIIYLKILKEFHAIFGVNGVNISENRVKIE